MSEENVFDNIQGVTYHFSKDGLLEDWREEALRHREEIEKLKDLVIALWHNDDARFLNKEQIDLLNEIIFGNEEDLGSDKE